MKILLYTSLIVLLIGCGEKTITNTIYTPGESAKGDIVGQVILDDPTGKSLLDQSGVLVTLENTSYFTTSDKSGNWIFKNIPAGIYTIAFFKDGFSSTKDFALSFNGNGTLYYNLYNSYGIHYLVSTILYQIIDGTPMLTLAPFQDYLSSRDSIYDDSLGNRHRDRVFDTLRNYQAEFQSSFGPAPADNLDRGVVVFFGKTNAVSASDPSTYSFATYQNTTGNGGWRYFPIYVYKGPLYTAGFIPGERVSCIVYSGSSVSVSERYSDPKLNHDVYSGVGKAHSEIKSFICP